LRLNCFSPDPFALAPCEAVWWVHPIDRLCCVRNCPFDLP
jgi:hypothetical protein